MSHEPATPRITAASHNCRRAGGGSALHLQHKDSRRSSMMQLQRRSQALADSGQRNKATGRAFFNSRRAIIDESLTGQICVADSAKQNVSQTI